MLSVVQNPELECLTVCGVELSIYTCLPLAIAYYTTPVEGISLKGESLQPTSPKQVEGQNGVSAQQSEASKDEEEVEASPFAAGKLDASYPPAGSAQDPAQLSCDVSLDSAPAELAGKGHGGLDESISVLLHDDQRARVPETRNISPMKLGLEEPAPHHMDAPAELTINEAKSRAGEFNSKQVLSIFVSLTPKSNPPSSRGSDKGWPFNHSR